MQLAAFPMPVITAYAATAVSPPVPCRIRFIAYTRITEDAILNPAGTPPRKSSDIFLPVTSFRLNRNTLRRERKYTAATAIAT